MKRISLVFGTRPEAIKMAPIILGLQKHPDIQPHVCVSGQHREMLDQVLQSFEIAPDEDLSLMQPDQQLGELTSKAILAIDNYLRQYKPDLLLVQGDTTTTFCASMAAFYNRIPLGHVEAGLRSCNKSSPYPEEINRLLTTRLADYHFVPTNQSRANLIKEDVLPDKIFVTGNTVIDALQIAISKVRTNPPRIAGLPDQVADRRSLQPLVLITGHRREDFGEGLRDICSAIARLAERFPQTIFVFPVHPNPNVRDPVFRFLSNKENVFLIEPLGYLPFVALMDRSTLILTDSGGIQEEAPSLGKPVLVTRETTERVEGLEAGIAKLVGTNSDVIVEAITSLLTNQSAYETMSRAINPYGDGYASKRIIDMCAHLLKTQSHEDPGPNREERL